MQAIFATDNVLSFRDVPVPTPNEGEVRIKVRAAGVNHADLFQRAGKYPPPAGASEVLGLEASGYVDAIGERVTRWKKGNAVCALLTGGGYAEYVTVPEGQVMPVPKGIAVEDAAAIPETFATVWQTLQDRAQIQRGETLLIHGGSSGIGSTAIQCGVLWGAKVFATASTPEKCNFIRELGATPIQYTKEDFVEVVLNATEGKGADVVLDMVGGDYIPRNIKVAAMDGRMVQIAFLKGAKIEANMAGLLMKRLSWYGSTLRSLSVEAKSQIVEAMEKALWPAFAAGELHPLIDRRFPFAEAEAAHAYMESGAHKGKILLEMP